MRPLREMETIQIEITNACVNQCANCTRLVGHHPKPYFMSMEQFTNAVDSLLEFPHMVGMMGGEPLLHPQFVEFCDYLHSMLPPEKCGLWTCLPKGKEHYRDVIVRTFGHIFLNDHTRDDVLHAPVLVPAREICNGDFNSMWYLIDHCWVQNGWSASINPNGAFFCEVAAALSLLLGFKGGWKVEPNWWEKIPKDFANQMDTFCPLCGCAMPLKRRTSIEGIDDISESMIEKIGKFSPKVKAGKYAVHNLRCAIDTRTAATYKDEKYRNDIAARYGMFLVINEQGYQTPYLKRNWEVKSNAHHNQQEGQHYGSTQARQNAL